LQEEIRKLVLDAVSLHVEVVCLCLREQLVSGPLAGAELTVEGLFADVEEELEDAGCS
jgi:hypothetical protein